MKWKNKKRIAYEIAKDFWNESSENLRYIMMEKYIHFINCTQDFDKPYQPTKEDYINLSKCNWKEIPLYRCDAEPSDLRTSVCYYLGIGLYEGQKSDEHQKSPVIMRYQREYKLRTLLS